MRKKKWISQIILFIMLSAVALCVLLPLFEVLGI